MERAGWNSESGFGITNLHTDFALLTYDFGAGPAPYPDAGSGPYTHYVDRSSVACTDISNAFGSPAKPRCSIPASLSEGSIAEVHGGPYTSGNDKIVITANGSASRPVYVRGANASSRPLFQRKILPQGQYVVFENLAFDQGGFDLRPFGGTTLNVIAVRDCEISGAGVGVAGVAGVILLRNHIHHNGDSLSAVEMDRHGVSLESGTSYVWILDNHIHHNSGDSLQMKNGAHHVYVGRNIMHEDRENAVDVKLAADVIISQNLMYGYRASTSSSGEAVVIHDDPSRVWLLNNYIAYANYGVVSSGASSVYAIGNIFTQMLKIASETREETSAYRSGAGIHFYNTADIHILNNTFSDVVVGLGAEMNASTSRAEIRNNIFGTVDSAQLGYQIVLGGNNAAFSKSQLENNLFFQSGGSARFSINGAFGSNLNNQINLDPKFESTGTGVFRLLAGSPAIDSAQVLNVYSEFFSLYGVAVNFDFDLKSRPRGAAMDVGAFEF